MTDAESGVNVTLPDGLTLHVARPVTKGEPGWLSVSVRCDLFDGGYTDAWSVSLRTDEAGNVLQEAVVDFEGGREADGGACVEVKRDGFARTVRQG